MTRLDGNLPRGQNAGMADISIASFGEAVAGDLFSVSGAGFEPGMALSFRRDDQVVRVSPEFVRPHLAVLAELPGDLPEGDLVLTAEIGEQRSEGVPLRVASSPAPPVRVLHAGARKELPYTIVFVANPVVRTEAGELVRDPVMGGRALFRTTVVRCLENLFLVEEDLLRAGDIDAQMRLVTVFVDDAEIDAGNCLASEVSAGYTETRRENLAPFLAERGVVADVVFVIFDSYGYASASAWPTTDDSDLGGLVFSFDGDEKTHGAYPRIPGSAAIPVTFNPAGITVLHEFGHAASAMDNGWVTDLYVDGEPGKFFINKKWRSVLADPVPSQFGTVDSRTYESDQDRANLSYPPDWKSYHPELLEKERPNVMDNYWYADDMHRCRFDRLTYRWFADRLAAKMQRE